MRMNNETKLKLSQKAHKRALKKLEGKKGPKYKKLYNYHKTVIEVQTTKNKKLSKSERQRIMEKL